MQSSKYASQPVSVAIVSGVTPIHSCHEIRLAVLFSLEGLSIRDVSKDPSLSVDPDHLSFEKPRLYNLLQALVYQHSILRCQGVDDLV